MAGLTNVTWGVTGFSNGGSVSGPTNGFAILNAFVNLPANASVTFNLIGVIDPNATGTLSSIVTVFAPAAISDPVLGNNFATDTDTLTPLGTADLSVTVTDGKTTVAPGTIDTYTITVTNNGPDTLSSLTLIEAVAPCRARSSARPRRGAITRSPGHGRD